MILTVHLSPGVVSHQVVFHPGGVPHRIRRILAVHLWCPTMWCSTLVGYHTPVCRSEPLIYLDDVVSHQVVIHLGGIPHLHSMHRPIRLQ